VDDRASIPGGGTDFSLRQLVHTDSGTQPTSYPVGTGGFDPGGKAAEA
jgi:hypothetical protein